MVDRALNLFDRLREVQNYFSVFKRVRTWLPTDFVNINTGTENFTIKNFQLDNEYFPGGAVVHQVAGKAGLLQYTKEARQLIIKELIKSHRLFNLEICNEFETIRERASNIPNTTKELLELGEYLTYKIYIETKS